MGHGVAGLDGRDDALHAGEILKRIHRLVVGDRHILRSSDVVQIRMLRADAGIVEPGGDGVDRRDLAKFVLAEIAFHPVKDAETSGCDGGGGLEGVHASARGLTANQPHRGLVDEMIKRADGVGAAAHTGQHHIREPPLFLVHLSHHFAYNNLQ